MSAPASEKARWTAAISAGASIRSRADHSASERSCPRASSAVAMPPSVMTTVSCSGRSVLVDVHPVHFRQRLERCLVALVDRDLQVGACLLDPTFVQQEPAERERPAGL